MNKKLRARVRGPPYQKVGYIKIYSSKFATLKKTNKILGGLKMKKPKSSGIRKQEDIIKEYMKVTTHYAQNIK